MEFMLLIVDPKGPATGERASFEEMGRFAAELRAAGKMRAGAPLEPEETGARVTVRGGAAVVTDGPFPETKELVAGYAVVEAASRAEAVEIARRCPAARGGIVEVRELPDRDAAATAAGGAPRFLFLLRAEPGLTDPDGSKYQEMLAYDDALKREGAYVESSRLGDDPPGARVGSRGGQLVVVDGPFAETKEVAGGYYVVEAPSRAAAIELAKRCPAARWGAVEVREAMKVGPV